MKKLNQKKEISVCKIARLQGITPRWAREFYGRYIESVGYPYPRAPGRKCKTYN